MKVKFYIVCFWILVIFVSNSLFLYAPEAYPMGRTRKNKDSINPVIPPKPKVSEKDNEVTKFEYHQQALKKTKKKNLKIKVAISRFEEETEIKGSPFNIQKDEEKTMNHAAVDIKDSDVTIKIDEAVEQEKVPKKELLTGLLTDALRNTEMFEVIERSDINELIREINFQDSQWVKKEKINTLGNIFGVQYVLTSSILRNENKEKIGKNYYTIAMRMYNVNTAEIISSSISNRPYLKDAVNKAVNDLAAQVESKAWSCRIVGVSDTGIHINAGLKDKLEKRDIFYVYRIEDEIMDPQTRESLGFGRKKIALIEIEEVLDENLSRIKVLEKYENIVIGDIVLAERIDKKEKSELKLWKEIYGTQKKDKDISDEDMEKYSLTSYNFSPEDIMEQFGSSIVKIQTDIGAGSGFIVTVEGSIITNFHVIQNAKFINVKMIEHNKYFTDIQVVNVNPARDIALLKINNAEEGLDSVTLGDSDNIKIGERVIAIGNPEGLENTISDGLISGIREVGDIKLIQTSVPVTHGSSGGPLVNMQGEVIGVVAAGLEKEGNLNFAVPINYVKEELL